MSSIQPGQFSFPPPSAFLNPAMQQVPPMQGMPMSQYGNMPPAFAGRKHEAGSAGANQHFLGTASLIILGFTGYGVFKAYRGIAGLGAKHFTKAGEYLDQVLDYAKDLWAKIPGVAKKATEAAETAAKA